MAKQIVRNGKLYINGRRINTTFSVYNLKGKSVCYYIWRPKGNRLVPHLIEREFTKDLTLALYQVIQNPAVNQRLPLYHSTDQIIGAINCYLLKRTPGVDMQQYSSQERNSIIITDRLRDAILKRYEKIQKSSNPDSHVLISQSTKAAVIAYTEKAKRLGKKEV